MKNLLLMIALFLCSVVANAKTYYVATTGSDSNPGTEAAPFKTWEKLSSVMVAGDIAYIHGGTYLSTKGASASVHCYFQNMHGTATNMITVQNYPGEKPVLDLTNVGVPTYSDPSGFYLKNCSYLHIKGLRITGLQQNHSGSGISRGFEIDNSPNCTFDQIEVDHIGGGAFHVYDNSNDTYFLNCDAHHNDDRYSSPSPWGGADGFSCTGGANTTRITFEGCRSWWNSDDGWDNFKTDGIRTWKNCWAFWNGYEPGTFTSRGNGEGFKLGPSNTDQSNNTIRFLQNCAAFENLDNGFDQNGTPTMLYQLYNNTAYGNHSNGFQFQYSSASAAQTLKNNASFNNGSLNFRYVGANNNITNNTWNGAVTVNASDFMTTTSTGVDGPRQADGSLPSLNYLKLTSNSDLINAGINVGLSFLSTAPDMGAFESNGSIVNVPPIANAGADQTITLPVSSVSLAGSGTDVGGSISSYLWTKVSGPTAGTITTPTAATTSITGLTQGAYTFQLKVTDNGGATATDNVIVTVNAATSNQSPVANAGVDKTITLPTSSVSLTGSGTDADGTIASYLWTKISGTGGTIATPTAATTSITGLTQGAYTFQLKVTDNGGATATDNVIVTVNAAGGGGSTGKIINVNIYGTSTYSNAAWNNWKPIAVISSGAFKYSDGTTSTASAILSRQKKILDNGSGYLSTATMCPPEVLRFASANQGSRTLTIKGLSTSKKYTFELYASSSVTGNKTTFAIGSSASFTITTDNNKTAKARFINVVPNSLGWVTFTITNTASWNYLNGFAITEQTSTLTSRSMSDSTSTTGEDIKAPEEGVSADTIATVSVFPLPFSTSFTVSLYGEAEGVYNLTLVDISGKTVWKKEVNKNGVTVNETIYMGNLPAGSYVLQVISPDQQKSAYTLIKN